jgi:hypothetical protein
VREAEVKKREAETGAGCANSPEWIASGVTSPSGAQDITWNCILLQAVIEQLSEHDCPFAPQSVVCVFEFREAG